MSGRLDIAAALTASGLVTGFEYRPAVLSAGAAWAQPTRWTFGEAGWSTGVTWQVWVVAAGDEQTAARWCDTNMAGLVAALRPWMVVTQAEPALIAAGGSGQLYGLILTGEAEQ